MKKKRRTINCVCCQQRGLHHGRGLINGCHQRHRLAGTLNQFPRTVEPGQPWQPTGPHGRRMLDRYAQLAAIRPPLSKKRIAWELGVSERSIERYAAALHAQTQTEAAA